MVLDDDSQMLCRVRDQNKNEQRGLIRGIVVQTDTLSHASFSRPSHLFLSLSSLAQKGEVECARAFDVI